MLVERAMQFPNLRRWYHHRLLFSHWWIMGKIFVLHI